MLVGRGEQVGTVPNRCGPPAIGVGPPRSGKQGDYQPRASADQVDVGCGCIRDLPEDIDAVGAEATVACAIAYLKRREANPSQSVEQADSAQSGSCRGSMARGSECDFGEIPSSEGVATDQVAMAMPAVPS